MSRLSEATKKSMYDHAVEVIEEERLCNESSAKGYDRNTDGVCRLYDFSDSIFCATRIKSLLDELAEVYAQLTAYKQAQQPAITFPEKLPCPVLLEPGARFGKGVPTSTMLGALQRRAEYHSELDAMTPEAREERERSIKSFMMGLETGQAFAPIEEVSIEELQRRYPPKQNQK